MVVVLSGGAGGGRFCRGVVRAVPEPEVTVICNTADDIDVYGVRVCPDLDLVTFTLAGVVDSKRGYGLESDPRTVMDELRAQGVDAWFDLGDRDLAICMARSSWLASGVPLDEIAGRIAKKLGVEARLIPMTCDPVWTSITTDTGKIHFQRWWVQHRAGLEPREVTYEGADISTPAAGVLDAIRDADAIVFAPSNPIVSIGPILSIPGISEAIAMSEAPLVAVTPIVAGAVLRGMADKLLLARGLEVSALSVATLYSDLIDGFVLDVQDADLVNQIEDLGIRVAVCDTIMKDDTVTTEIARTAIALAEQIGVTL